MRQEISLEVELNILRENLRGYQGTEFPEKPICDLCQADCRVLFTFPDGTSITTCLPNIKLKEFEYISFTDGYCGCSTDPKHPAIKMRQAAESGNREKYYLNRDICVQAIGMAIEQVNEEIQERERLLKGKTNGLLR